MIYEGFTASPWKFGSQHEIASRDEMIYEGFRIHHQKHGLKDVNMIEKGNKFDQIYGGLTMKNDGFNGLNGSMDRI